MAPNVKLTNHPQKVNITSELLDKLSFKDAVQMGLLRKVEGGKRLYKMVHI